MDAQTMVVAGAVALVVIVLLLLIRAGGARRRTPRMHPLSPEARERYISDWDDVEAKFVDAPEQAVREAEALVMSVLRERGHPLTERDQPSEMRRARKLSHTSRDKTEALRLAMLQYRGIMERMMGSPEAARSDVGRREIAAS
jgi:hypothetical protein